MRCVEMEGTASEDGRGSRKRREGGDEGRPNGKEASDEAELHQGARQQKQQSIFGNYKHYYGYRLNHDLEEDPRLKLFDRKWFEGKDCLDIGCNKGYITISIAMKFFCKSILGVDIDQELVKEAWKQLRNQATLLQKERDTRIQEADQNNSLGISEEVQASRNMVSDDLHTDNGNLSSASEQQRKLNSDILRQTVRFRVENFIQTLESYADTSFDTVLCLSLTKWVHLNWGDKGLILLFAKILRILHPGGILVLEPQPWSSYKRKHHVSEVARRNFREIALRPEHFPELLLDKIGFRSMEKIIRKVPQSSRGFNRPIFLFYK